MSRLVDSARRRTFTLVVSVPANRAEMAKAAEAGGADAMKVHLNCKHPASGKIFGSFAREKRNLESVLKSVSIPVGVVPGGAISPRETRVAAASELEELHRMGFDFFDVFAHHMPLDYLAVPMGKMVCIDSRYSKPEVDALAASGVEMFEASVIPHEGYGEPVAFADLARWRVLTSELGVPMLISTQRKIRPEECALLRDAGAKGVVIGVVVTGMTAGGVEKVTSLFRKAIDRL